MSVYEHDRDDPDAAARRAAQEDPSVMYLVVRKTHGASTEELLAAAARATFAALDRYADDPRHREAFAYWLSSSFRKVCLRANEREWPRVLGLDGGDGRVEGEVVVRALPPRRRSEREKLLVQLQAYTAEAAELPTRAVPVPAGVPVMVLVRNAEVAMRMGKLVAQIGHAVLLGASAFADDVPAWRDGGCACAVRGADAEGWAALQRDERCAVVRDAGLTEVSKGAETFLALRPAAIDAWPARVRALPGP